MSHIISVLTEIFLGFHANQSGLVNFSRHAQLGRINNCHCIHTKLFTSILHLKGHKNKLRDHRMKNLGSIHHSPCMVI